MRNNVITQPPDCSICFHLFLAMERSVKREALTPQQVARRARDVQSQGRGQSAMGSVPQRDNLGSSQSVNVPRKRSGASPTPSSVSLSPSILRVQNWRKGGWGARDMGTTLWERRRQCTQSTRRRIHLSFSVTAARTFCLLPSARCFLSPRLCSFPILLLAYPRPCWWMIGGQCTTITCTAPLDTNSAHTLERKKIEARGSTAHWVKDRKGGRQSH